MKLIDNHDLLTANQTKLLHQNVGEPFSFGEFKSLDDILTKLDVEVIIEPGIVYHSVPESLKDADAFWKGLAKCGAPSNYRITHLKDFTFRNANLDSTKIVDETAINIYEKIRKEKESLLRMPIRGLYDPEKNCIKLYPEEMRQEYGGMRMNELLVSTLAHETMHAYFNRPGHDKYPYIYLVEEPLAEFGMLVYLHQTGSSYYNWAFNDVRGKRTCYHYGADLMALTLTLKAPSNSSYYKYLLGYKKSLPICSTIHKASNGTIVITTAKAYAKTKTRLPRLKSKRAIIKTAFDNLYADLGYDLTDYLRTNLDNGTMTRTPATIQLTNGSFVNVWKWAPTGSSRAILLEVNKADYPRMDTVEKYKDRDRYFADIYEANQLYPDSVFLLSNQWGAGSNSFNHIIDDFCKSVNIMTAKTGRLSPYFSPADITYLKTPVRKYK